VTDLRVEDLGSPVRKSRVMRPNHGNLAGSSTKGEHATSIDQHGRSRGHVTIVPWLYASNLDSIFDVQLAVNDHNC
jgi:hypothetical protein